MTPLDVIARAVDHYQRLDLPDGESETALGVVVALVEAALAWADIVNGGGSEECDALDAACTVYRNWRPDAGADTGEGA